MRCLRHCSSVDTEREGWVRTDVCVEEDGLHGCKRYKEEYLVANFLGSQERRRIPPHTNVRLHVHSSNDIQERKSASFLGVSNLRSISVARQSVAINSEVVPPILYKV